MAMSSTKPFERAVAYAPATLAYLRAADERRVVEASHTDSLDAWILKLAKHVAAKDAKALPALAMALKAAAPLEQQGTAAQRGHLAAARAWLAREPLQAARIYTHIAESAPHDLLAVRLAQSGWYFLGQRARVRLVAERALHQWSQSDPGYDVLLAMTAFGRAENGDGRGATALAQRALRIEARSPYAWHALAHGLITEGRTVTAHRALADSQSLWRIGGRMDAHIAWHQAVYALKIGRSSEAVALFDRELASANDASTCADATDLLWRLELAGAATGLRWHALAAAWSRHFTPGFWGFLDVLAGIAFERAGRSADAKALRKAISETQATESTAATRQALAAIDAFTQGDHARACGQLRAALPLLGGSVPQRELLELTLAAAEQGSGGECLVAAAA